MTTLDQWDFERVSKAVSFHLQHGQIEISRSLIKTLRFLLDSASGSLSSEMDQIYHKTIEEVREVLVTQRQMINDDKYREILRLFEENVVLISEGKEAQDEQDDSEVYLSTGEVAKKIGVSTQTVLNMINDGRIQASRPFGTHYKIPASQFEEADRQIQKFRGTLDKLHSRIKDQVTEEDLEEFS